MLNASCMIVCETLQLAKSRDYSSQLVTLCVCLFHRRLGVELGKSVVFQESNRGEENITASRAWLTLKRKKIRMLNISKYIDVFK